MVSLATIIIESSSVSSFHPFIYIIGNEILMTSSKTLNMQEIQLEERLYENPLKQ